MPKLKTHKATAKRFKIKKSKKGTKILKRADGQDHFNARQSGKKKRNKSGILKRILKKMSMSYLSKSNLSTTIPFTISLNITLEIVMSTL